MTAVHVFVAAAWDVWVDASVYGGLCMGSCQGGRCRDATALFD